MLLLSHHHSSNAPNYTRGSPGDQGSAELSHGDGKVGSAPSNTHTLLGQGWAALTHSFTHFTYEHLINDNLWQKGQTICIDPKPQTFPSSLLSAPWAIHHLHTHSMKAQSRNKAPTLHQSWGVTGAPWPQNDTWLQLFPHSTHPGKPSTSLEASRHGTIPETGESLTRTCSKSLTKTYGFLEVFCVFFLS